MLINSLKRVGCILGCFLLSAAQAAILYENPFSGSEAGPDPAVSATAFTEPLKLTDSLWVPQLIGSVRSSGNKGGVAASTYAGWFKVPDISAEHELFRITGVAGSASGKTVKIYTEKTSGLVAVNKIGGENRITRSASAVTAGEWFHIAVVFPSDANVEPTVTIYLNGTANTGTIYNDLTETAAAELWVGSAGISAARVLVDYTPYTASEAAATMSFDDHLYTAFPTATALNETQKLAVADHPWIAPLISKRWATNGRACVNMSTYSGWFKADDLAAERELFRIVGNAASPDGYRASRAYLSTDGKISVKKMDGSTLTSSGAIAADEWFHLAVVFTTSGTANYNSYVTLYLNGIPTTAVIWNDLVPTSCVEFWIGAAGFTVRDINVYRIARTANDIHSEYANYSATIAADTNWSDLLWSSEGTPAVSDSVQLIATHPAMLAMDAPAEVASLIIDGSAPLTIAGPEALTAQATGIFSDLTVAPGSAALGAVSIASGKTLTVAGAEAFTSLSVGSGQTLRLCATEALTSLQSYYALLSGGWLALGAGTTVNIPEDGLLEPNIENRPFRLQLDEGSAVTAPSLILNNNKNVGDVVINGGSLTLTSESKVYSVTSSDGALFIGNWEVSPASLELRSGSLSVENGVVNLGRDATGIAFKIGTDSDPVKAAATIAKLYGIGAGSTRPEKSAVVTFANGTVTLGAGGLNIPATEVLKSFELTGPVTLTASEDWALAATHASGFQTKATGANTPIIDPAGHTITLDGIISGTGALKFTGTGIINLNAINTYSGGTIIEGGVTVKAASIGTGPLSVANTTFNLGLLRPPSLTVTAPSTLAITVTSTELAQERAVILSNVTEAEPGFLTTIITDAAGTRFGTELDGTDLILTKLTLTWNGSDDLPNWDLISENWLEGETPTTFSTGADVIFPEGGFTTITLNETVKPARITLAGEGYTFSGEGSVQASVITGHASSTFNIPVQALEFTAAEGTTQTLSSLTAHPDATIQAKYLKLTFTANGGGSDGVAVAELALFNGSNYVPWPNGSSVALGSGNNTVSNNNELPRSLIDGYYGSSTANTSWGAATKNNKLWISNPNNFRYGNGLVFATITLPEAITFNGYRLCSTDHNPRSAKGWQLHASMDGTTWILLDAKADQTIVANAWYGDTSAADSSALPAAPQTRNAPVILSGAGNFNIATLGSGTIINQSTGTLTMTGDNSAFTGSLNALAGTTLLGIRANIPKNLNINHPALTRFTVDTEYPVFTALSGDGTLELQFNAESAFIAPGLFTGTIRQLAATAGENPKMTMLRKTVSSVVSSYAWIEVMNGAQFWASDDSRTLKLRLAGEAGGLAEPYGGALRLQSGNNLTGQIELMEDATITGGGKTLASAITVAEGTAATLRLGIAKKIHTSVDGAITLTGLLSGREGFPLSVWVNGHSATFKGGTGANMGTFTVRHRTDATSQSGNTAGTTGAALTGDTAKTYTFANVEVGGGQSGKIESLTIGANATLAVTEALTVTESDSTVIVANGGTLDNVGGTIAGSLTLQAGSTLKLAGNTLTTASLILPEEGTVAIEVEESLLASGKVYIVKGTNASYKTAFSGIPEKWLIDSDTTGIYIRKIQGTLVSLY